MGEGSRSKCSRVLVVDDDRAEREGLARLIARWGYDVEAVGSCDEALSLTERYRPAVVITDLILPGTDGLDLLRQLKAGPTPPIVLMVTGHATVESTFPPP